MKKVFLSLAVIAALTVVSCKQAEKPAEEAAPVEAAPAPAADTTKHMDTMTAQPAKPAEATKTTTTTTTETKKK